MSYNLRNNHLPHPMYGINQPFSIADLSSGYNSGLTALTQVSGDTTSSLLPHGGNGFEINPQFGDGVTSCSIDVTNSEGTLLKTFNNVSKLNAQGLFIGYADDGILLGGDPCSIRAYNFVGGGKVTIKIRKTS